MTFFHLKKHCHGASLSDVIQNTKGNLHVSVVDQNTNEIKTLHVAYEMLITPFVLIFSRPVMYTTGKFGITQILVTNLSRVK